MSIREIVQGGLLTALSLLIPLVFGSFLVLRLPPFTATVASHVPTMISMTISPAVAFMVAAGSAIGFLITSDPVVAMRASMHIIFALVGAKMYQKGISFPKVLLATLPLHAITEALVVIPFGFTLQKAGVVVGIGTALHHGLDSLITLAIFGLIGSYLARSKSTNRR
ncbi:MAG: ECF transporter S component [Peptococcia bacterium]